MRTPDAEDVVAVAPVDLAPPAWIEVRRGRSPLLLFAPHGGRRTAPRRPGRDKVNDLHTAELTRELGIACDATWIVNATRDRNEIDLNRTEQVRRHAPWLLELLASTLEEMVARCGRATVLAVHGWNVVQPVCDVGVGLIESDGECRRAVHGEPTTSAAFLDSRVRALQRRADARGIVVTIGARYPAAHPSNVMQVFTAARADDADPTLRRLASVADRVDAAQLELGIPLRWPGERRRAFMRTLIEVFSVPGAGPDPAATRPPPAPALACGGRPTTRLGLQLAAGPLAVLTSIDVAPAGAVAGRLLVSDAPNRLALLTGELTERGASSLHVPALRVLARGRHAFDVRFVGPLLSFPMLTPFSDLEHGLAAGTLVEARLDLRFRPADALAHVDRGGARFGAVDGVIRLGSARHRIRVPATSSEGLAPPLRHPSMRLTLPDTALGAVDVRSATPGLAPATPTAAGDAAVAMGPFRFVLDGVAWPRGSGATPLRGEAEISLTPPAAMRVRLEADAESLTLAGPLVRLIPVRRPGVAGAVVETVYGLCDAAGAAPGWLELTVEHATERAADRLI